MDIDPVEAAEDSGKGRLGAAVAITVALLATFLGICNIKDDNIKQAMDRAQSERLDHWNFYQARNIREEVMTATAAQMRAAAAAAPAAQRAAYEQTAIKYEQLAADQATKKAELQKQALADEKTYDALNYRDDQFDISDALLALAISLLAVTALTHKRWLFYLALVPTAGGVLMGLAALLGWRLHPEMLANLLT
jgi:hypothetical protein